MLRSTRGSLRLLAVALLCGFSVALLLGAAAAVATPARAAPRAELQVERGPYYVGEPIELHVRLSGFERSPEPQCAGAAPAGADLRLAGVVPTVSSSVQIINGKVTRTETVTFTCQYVLVASQAGAVRLEPFRAEQAGRVVRTGPAALDVEEVPLDPRVRLHIEMPEGPVYVGQQIPVRIEWWIDATLKDSIQDYAIRGPLFERPDTFRFLDDEVAMRGDQSLEITTTEGEVALRAGVEERRDAGRRYLVVAAERRMVPLRTGSYALDPATVTVDEVTRWQRDLFGSRRPAATERLFARSGPLAFGVEEPPARGRPASFGGAIGSGFSLEVSADRSVVRRGDPITLRLTIRGDAHLPTLGPPPLTGPGGLPPEDFRLLEDELSGEVQDGAKRFEATVRVLDEDVREIPAIEYAWFDPETGEYRTTRSRPIALSVRPAEVVSADDVVAATPSGEEAGAGDAGAAARRGAAPGRRDTDEGDAASLALQADLSIEERIDRLVARPGATWPLETALYGGGLAVVLAAASWRRRSRTSPRVARLRALHRAERARIDAAARLPRREGLTEIATALRALSQADPALRSTEVDAFVRECDEILYAPAGDGSAASDTVDADRVRRARALADALGARIR